MTDPIDWTDETPRSLSDLARTAFPGESGITADTLKRQIRKGKLVAYRPGKTYLSTYAAVREMIGKVQVKREPNPAEKWRAPRPEPPDPFGRTPAQVASDVLDHVLDKLTKQHEAKKEEQRRNRAVELARTEPERRRRRLEERRAKARAKYLEKKAARASEIDKS
jgi:hypothetical protein